MKKLIFILLLSIFLSSCSNYYKSRYYIYRENFNKENLELSLNVYENHFSNKEGKAYLINYYLCSFRKDCYYYISEFRFISEETKDLEYNDNIDTNDDVSEIIEEYRFNYIDRTRMVYGVSEEQKIYTLSYMYVNDLVGLEYIESIKKVHKILYPNLY